MFTRIILILFLLPKISYSQFIDYVEHSNRDFKYHKKNCVQYLHSLLIGYDKSLMSDTKFQQEVYIDLKLPTEQKSIKDRKIVKLLKNDSPIPKGGCSALVKRGKAIYTKKPIRGDIFQFWIIQDDWVSGHCGIIKEVLGKDKYLIISSYNENNVKGERCNGYCESVMDIKDMQISYIWFVHLK